MSPSRLPSLNLPSRFRIGKCSRNSSPQFRCFSISSNRSKMMSSSSISAKSPKIVTLKPIDATPSTFAEFGQVITVSPDRQKFGPHDAQLELHRGTPRFYIMHLEDQELKFNKITHHASVTQCLGSIGGQEWFLCVAKASIINGNEMNDGNGKTIVLSASGHYYLPPGPDDVRVFRIEGSKFVKLNVGTWHAGPLFKSTSMDFYNLELSNTNVVDHTTHDFLGNNGVVFLIED